MLLSKTVFINWNAKIKKHYVDLGYKYTKMGDSFEVKVEDLTHYSNAYVDIECDYCHRKYKTKWGTYLKSKEKLVKKDCCNNPECTGKKAQETLQTKYNVSNFREIPGINEKIAATNLERYGSENPFGSKEIMDKIKETNLLKYGTEWYMQTDEAKRKIQKNMFGKIWCPKLFVY